MWPIAFDLKGMYSDGMNLYQYLASNPWNRSDPLGLSSDPFEEIDAIIDEIYGSRAATLSALGKDAMAAAVVAARIASYLPIPGVGLVGELALVALGEQSGGEALAGIALGIIPGGKLIGKAGKGIFKALGNIGGAAWKQASALASKGGGFLARKADGLFAKAKSFISRKPAGACGCFTAATLVWTAHGMVPIAEIQQGQQVFAAPEAGGAWDAAEAEVGASIVIGEASLVYLTVQHQDGLVEVIETTDEHPFHVADTGEWTRADGLQIGDRLSTIVGTAELLIVGYGGERVPVYNLSIPGRPTYYVGSRGVWVHNCSVVLGRALHLVETGFQSFTGRSLDDVAGHLDDLVAAGWKKSPASSGNGWKWSDPKIPGRQIRWHPGGGKGGRFDPDGHFGGDSPYWTYSHGSGNLPPQKFPAN